MTVLSQEIRKSRGTHLFLSQELSAVSRSAYGASSVDTFIHEHPHAISLPHDVAHVFEFTPETPRYHTPT